MEFEIGSIPLNAKPGRLGKWKDTVLGLTEGMAAFAPRKEGETDIQLRGRTGGALIAIARERGMRLRSSLDRDKDGIWVWLEKRD